MLSHASVSLILRGDANYSGAFWHSMCISKHLFHLSTRSANWKNNYCNNGKQLRTVQVAGNSFVSAGLLESLQDVIAVWILQASGGSLSCKKVWLARLQYCQFVRQQILCRKL